MATYTVTWQETARRTAELTSDELAALLGVTPAAVDDAEPEHMRLIDQFGINDTLAELDDAEMNDFQREHITITRSS